MMSTITENPSKGLLTRKVLDTHDHQFQNVGPMETQKKVNLFKHLPFQLNKSNNFKSFKLLRA